MLKNTDKILFGGDYNPEQWPQELWEEDMRLFQKAHVSVVTLNVFSWSALQPSENEYDFSKLDKIMELSKKHDLKVFLATSTSAHPAWMAKQYPDTLKTDAQGRKRHFGGRQNMCPNSPVFRKYAGLLVQNLAERYQSYDNIAAWHISNEYGGYCYCETCTKSFRKWLEKRYQTIDALNNAWNTSFWSHTFYDWDEIVLPDFLSEEFHFGSADGPVKSTFQGISLDYRRFMTDSYVECFDMEKDIIRKYTPDVPVTTNFMGDYSELNYTDWASHMDFVSWDNYPSYDQKRSDTSFWHDLMRGIGHGKAFSLMEQTPGVSNWHPYCSLKRPGVLRLWSYQAMAHGADTVMFFQMRRSIGACEKYHSALIDHVGTKQTRVFKEMAALGQELEQLGSKTLNAVSPAKAAIVFDFENWWATSLSAGPTTAINYLEEIRTWYRFFNTSHIPVDILSPADSFSDYRLILAPMLYMSDEGFENKLREYVQQGGQFVTSYFSGYVNKNDNVYLGGYPAKWRDILGIWIEESDALIPGKKNYFNYKKTTYSCNILCDLIHLEGAVSLGEYQEDFYSSMPVITENSFGKGTAYYVGTRSEESFYQSFLSDICNDCDIKSIMDAPACMEITERVNSNGHFLYLLNHSEQVQSCVIPYSANELISGSEFKSGQTLSLQPRDVMILKQSSNP